MKKILLLFLSVLSWLRLAAMDHNVYIQCSDGEIKHRATVLKKCKTLGPILEAYTNDYDFDLTYMSHHADKDTVELLFNALENKPLPYVHPKQAEKLLRLADDMAVSRKEILKIAKRYENDLVLDDKPELSWLLKVSKEIPHKYLKYKTQGGNQPLFFNMFKDHMLI